MGKRKKQKIQKARECLWNIVKKNIGRMKISLVQGSRTRTIITGINPNLEEALEKFRMALCCGGFIQGKEIVLQGDHEEKFGNIAIKLGYSKEQILKTFNSPPLFFV